MSRVLAWKASAIAFAACFGLGTQGCKAKPSEEACRDAIHNIRKIAGQGTSDVGADPIAAIRSCRGNSSKEAVDCMRQAKTLDDLDACEGDVDKKFYPDQAKQNADTNKVDEKPAEAADAKPTETTDAKPTETTDAKPVETTDEKPAEAADAAVEDKPAP